MNMPSKKYRETHTVISVPMSSDDNQRLSEIVKLARMVNPKITQTEVIRKMIGDLYRNLVSANLLPPPNLPAIIDMTAGLGRKGNGEMPNGE